MSDTAPTDDHKADLVLEGGGVKGIALAGAVSVLEERGYEFPRVAGTSAGAIVGALVAAGVKAADLTALMESLDYGRFKDQSTFDRIPLLGKAASLLFAKGIYEGNHLRVWLAGELERCGVERFGDLRRTDERSTLAPHEDFRLVVMASDVSAGRLRRIPWECEAIYGVDPAELAVADAVRASMSIPFFFEPVVAKHATNGEKTWLVDGGMLSNFPVDVFDRTDGKPPRWPTFGIKLSMRAKDLQAVRYKVSNTFTLARALVGTMTSWYDRMHLDAADVLARTIFVDTFGVSSTDFDLDRATAKKLYDSGREAATRFLDGDGDQPGWDFDRYVEQFRPPG